MDIGHSHNIKIMYCKVWLHRVMKIIVFNYQINLYLEYLKSHENFFLITKGDWETKEFPLQMLSSGNHKDQS